METGLILALIASVSFAIGIVMVRKAAGDTGEAFTVAAMSIFAGIPFFAVAISASGDWGNLQAISIKAAAMLAAAGIIHYVIGRLLAYESWRLIGANRGTPITQISPAYTVILSWIFLDEILTFYIIFGALFMIAGVFLISREEGSFNQDIKMPTRDKFKGIMLALGASLCWGISPILIKPGVELAGSASVGTFISYTAAGIVMALLLTNRTRRHQFARLSLRKNIFPMALAGLFTAGGQLLFYSALSRSQANTVSPLISIEILFVFLLSFLVNRHSESFTLKVALGMAAAVIGTFLLFQ